MKVGDYLLWVFCRKKELKRRIPKPSIMKQLMVLIQNVGATYISYVEMATPTSIR
jgi:hypothetical protein